MHLRVSQTLHSDLCCSISRRMNLSAADKGRHAVIFSKAARYHTRSKRLLQGEEREKIH